MLVQFQSIALVKRAFIEIMMVTVLTLTSVLLKMIVLWEPNAGIQLEVTDAFAKLAISEMELIATRVSALMKHSVGKMSNVLARLVLTANARRVFFERL